MRIVATLTGQIRGWLWVSLLEQQGERDVAVIAKAAGIGNPKRIYVMRKQLPVLVKALKGLVVLSSELA